MTVRLDFEDEKLSTLECARTIAALDAAVRARLKINTFRLHVMDEDDEWEVLQSATQLEHRLGVVDVLVEQTKPTVDRRGRRESLPTALAGAKKLMKARLEFEGEKLQAVEVEASIEALRGAVSKSLSLPAFELLVLDEEDEWAKLESNEQLQVAWERLWTAQDQGVLEVLVIQAKPTVDRRGRRDSVPQLPPGFQQSSLDAGGASAAEEMTGADGGDKGLFDSLVRGLGGLPSLSSLW
jgi:hypothetical protein